LAADDGGGGSVCLMGTGCYANDGRNPVAVTGYLAEAAGWGTPELLPSGFNGKKWLYAYDLSPLQAWRYQNPNEPGEYFIIEKRRSNARDANIPETGIMVWNVNAWENIYAPNLTDYEWQRVDKFGDGMTSSPKWMDGTASGLSMHATGHGNNATYVNVTTTPWSVAVTFDATGGTPSGQVITMRFCGNYSFSGKRSGEGGACFSGVVHFNNAGRKTSYGVN